MNNVSLIIPAFNEAKRIGEFMASIVRWHDSSLDQEMPRRISEIIVIDDGSSDETVNVVERYKDALPMLKVISHQRNHGKGAAVQTGVMAAQGNLVVFIDADGATPIEELPKMITALQGKQIGIGNRWMPGAKAELHSSLRSLSSWLYRTYMILFSLGAIDTMCGFKGFRREIARDLFRELLEERWLFDTEVAYKAVRRGYSIENFPIAWASKDGSKLDTKTLISSAMHIFPLIMKINLLEKSSRADKPI